MSYFSSFNVPKQNAICASFLISPACTPTVALIFISCKEFLSIFDFVVGMLGAHDPSWPIIEIRPFGG